MTDEWRKAHLAKLHAQGHSAQTKRKLSRLKRKPPRSALPIVHRFFDRLDIAGLTNKEVALKAGLHAQSLINWRRGVSSPNMRDFELAATALGYKLALVPDYPEGEVVGACICGSWPGGECLRCPEKEARR